MTTTPTNAIGRRKAAVARVFLRKGKGNITVNGKEYKEYFKVPHLIAKVELPLKTVELAMTFDYTVNVDGGGVKGQADSVKLAISRALIKEDAEVRPALKLARLLVRDPRSVERKKPGLRKARKRSQFSKR
jgi:small subunit ribosomal protein S9